MRKTVIFGLLFSALALGQAKQTAAGLHKQGTAGPGYIQSSFVDALSSGMEKKLGPRTAARMLEYLRGQSDLDADDVLKIINGRVSKSDLRKRFGAKRLEVAQLGKALDGAVLDKERRLFFGILVKTMVADDVDPSSSYCKSVGETCSAIDDADFAKLKSGNRSTSLIEDIFGFKDKVDKKAMQRYLNKATSSALMDHPMMGSFTKKSGKSFDKSAFPELKPGMPGTGKEYEDGKAGGLPFDAKLPACPFYGKNLEEFFKDKKD